VLELSRKLATIDKSLTLEVGPDGLVGGAPDLKRLRDLYTRLELRVLLKSLEPPSLSPAEVPAAAQAALREQSRRQAEERLRAGRRWHDEGLIFTGEHRYGGALSGATVVHVLHRLCDASGVPRIRVHDLRHLHATVLG